MGYRKLTARPKHYAQDPQVIDELKNFPTAVAEITAGAANGKRIEIWFQDAARIGRKNKITRLGQARNATFSAARSAYKLGHIFGAICPKLRKAAALIMPWCDTFAMTQHRLKSLVMLPTRRTPFS